MRLQVEESRPGEAVVLVRWCLSKANIKAISKKCQPGEAQILLSSISTEADKDDPSVINFKEESRQVIPIEKMATFVTFSRPGPHQIIVAVIRLRGKRRSILELNRHGYGPIYEEAVVNEEGGKFWLASCRSWEFEIISIGQKNIAAETTVEVDENFFAQEPWDAPCQPFLVL